MLGKYDRPEHFEIHTLQEADKGTWQSIKLLIRTRCSLIPSDDLWKTSYIKMFTYRERQCFKVTHHRAIINHYINNNTKPQELGSEKRKRQTDQLF